MVLDDVNENRQSSLAIVTSIGHIISIMNS